MEPTRGRATSARRVVSLVPSLTEAVAAFGLADRLVGVTKYCTRGAPATAERLGGTKNPDVERIVALGPDVVLANAEENREPDLQALRAAGLHVLVTFPKAVADVAPMLVRVGRALGVPPRVTADVGASVARAVTRATALRPRPPVSALTLVWRKPWMGLGSGTYADDLLHRCGFDNILAASPARYPRLRAGDCAGARVVLLPSEPYAFGEGDLEAVRALVEDVPHRFVDGRLLTWHGPSTAEALDRFSALATELAGGQVTPPGQ